MGTILTMCLFFGLTFNMIFLEFCAPPGTTLPGLLSVPKAKATWLNKKKKKKEKKKEQEQEQEEENMSSCTKFMCIFLQQCMFEPQTSATTKNMDGFDSMSLVRGKKFNLRVCLLSEVI
jgi:hypothetical protein